MRCVKLFLLFIVIGGSWPHVRCTCVLESEFGFTINCAFKKSGLFRVRNLGGIKAHIGLGFTVGDELGFRESLSNIEGSRRRSTQTNGFQNAILVAAANTQRKDHNRLTVQQPMQQQQVTAQSQQIQQPVFVNAVPKTSMQNTHAKLYGKMGVTVPPFRPIPPAAERPIISLPTTFNTTTKTHRVGAAAAPAAIPKPTLMGIAVPAFQEMPASISRISDMNETKEKPIATINHKFNNELSAVFVPNASTSSIQSLAAASNISVEAIEAAILLRQQQLKRHQLLSTPPPTTTTTMSTTIIPVTTSAPTYRPSVLPPKRHIINNVSKVMNAPKEYYPVGYDKNFDDNFVSKVELPDTSFYCGDQKHFPGLYADEELGCMVFHLCALTDDGLIMKSFLCPESTLFDQTVLKCNWWFYVDCKNSKKLYDSNIPISKSYQLMKALTFFSSYKKNQETTTTSSSSTTTKTATN